MEIPIYLMTLHAFLGNNFLWSEMFYIEQFIFQFTKRKIISCTISLGKKYQLGNRSHLHNFIRQSNMKQKFITFFLHHLFVHHNHTHAEPLYLLFEQEWHKKNSEEIQWDGSHKAVNCPGGDELPLISQKIVLQPEVVILCPFVIKFTPLCFLEYPFYFNSSSLYKSSYSLY